MLKKIDRFFILVQKHVGGILFCAIFFFCIAQVVCRYLLKVSSPWTEEFARVGMVWMTFLSAAYCIRLNAHPSVDFLVKKLPLRLYLILMLLIELLIAGIGVILLKYGWDYVLRTDNDLSTTYHYPKSVWYFPIPVSGAITILYSIRNVFHIVRAFLRKEELDWSDDTDNGGDD